MTHSEKHVVQLSKPAQRQLGPKVIEKNLNALIAATNNKSLANRGWLIDAYVVSHGNSWVQKFAFSTDHEYEYILYMSITYDHHTPPAKDDLPAILRSIYSRAGQPAFGKWTLSRVDDDEYRPPDTDTPTTDDLIGYTDVSIPDDWDDNFAHLFGLDSHIRRVRLALEAGVESGWRNRFHAALVGPPGCGKSDICRSIKEALGEDAVLEFDATATTAAGAIKELSEREILPRVIVIEEIEKADEKTMSFLLGVLDLRGEIRKTTARATIQRNTKLFAIATVNDVPLFEKLQAGALASRFTNRIHFKRPSRETLALILTREVQKINGKREWIAPTLDYCEEHGITDPRQVIAICLCGRDDLLSGVYQKMLADTGNGSSD